MSEFFDNEEHLVGKKKELPKIVKDMQDKYHTSWVEWVRMKESRKGQVSEKIDFKVPDRRTKSEPVL